MCLAVPGRLTETYTENGLRMGRVDFDGTVSAACLELLPEAERGQYVLVHAGFALHTVEEEEARKTLQLWRQLEGEDAEATLRTMQRSAGEGPA